MNSAQARDAYRQSDAQSKIHPVKLIHLMYERTLVHLEVAEEGITRKDPKMRGENLGKAIAIITELNASIREEDESEAALFLRGLYSAILVELPKVSVSEDVAILRQTKSYIKKLKEIWEDTAMEELKQVSVKPQADSPESEKSVVSEKAAGKMYGTPASKVAVQGVSFSI